MLELNALSFMSATTQLSRINQIVNNSEAGKQESLLPASIATVKPMLESFGIEAANIGAKLAWVSADRLYRQLINVPCELTWGQLGIALQEVEGRFADHLGFIKLFVVHDGQSILFSSAEQLLGEPAASLFPSVWFDCEEAAKCLCMARSTACVFHSMRMLEIGLQALAKRLDIPNPAKATDRNWGNMLNSIKKAIDETYPASGRLTGTQGAFLESVYVTLDAIKNPWRNSTMHVEATYTEAEANHILTSTSILIAKMASGFDEEGKTINLEDNNT